MEGKKHGLGTFTNPRGGKYKGEFKYGKKHGNGTLISRAKKNYFGEYKEGNFWNVKIYDKNGKLLGKIVNGIMQ